MIRAGRFTAVAMAGFVLQTAVLEALTAADLHYLPATLLAVEAAILHNYVWHERWTWRDRGTPPGSRTGRLVRYHGLTAAVSLGGQALTVILLTGGLGLRPSIASAIAVVALGRLTYAGAGRFVFPPPPPTGPKAPRDRTARRSAGASARGRLLRSSRTDGRSTDLAAPGVEREPMACEEQDYRSRAHNRGVRAGSLFLGARSRAVGARRRGQRRSVDAPDLLGAARRRRVR